MSFPHRPAGFFCTDYKRDEAWWATPRSRAKAVFVAMLVFVVIPALFSEEWLEVAIKTGYTALAALGVHVLTGMAGLVTLGQAAFTGVGAFAAVALLTGLPWPQAVCDAGLAWPLCLLGAAFITGFYSALWGLASTRTKGFYLILVTVAAQIITVDFLLSRHVARALGFGQVFFIPSEVMKLGPFSLADSGSPLRIYLVMAFLCLLTGLGVANLARTRAGRAWKALARNEAAAAVLGISVVWGRVSAFFVSGFLAGVAGAFWTAQARTLSAEHFSFSFSLWLVGVVLVGGAGSLPGVFFGAVFLEGINALLDRAALPLSAAFGPAAMAHVKEVAFGLSVCLFVVFEPNGLGYRWRRIALYFTLWPFSRRASEDGG